MTSGGGGRGIFRAEALARLASPEQTDQLLQVVDRNAWLPLLTLAGLITLAGVWAVVGEIPVAVDGRGFLTFPRQVVGLQSPGDGQLVALDLRVGDVVGRGQVIGRINQPALQQRLDQNRVRLAELRARNAELGTLQAQRSALEREALARKREVLERRIVSARRMADTQQRLLDTLRRRFESMKPLLAKKLLNETALLDARLAVIEAEETYQQQQNALADYQTQIGEIGIKVAELAREERQADSDRALAIQEAERAVARAEKELRVRGQVASEFAGRVLEVTASIGQVVAPGQRLGSVEAVEREGDLTAVAYLPVAGGKRVSAEMRVQVTPDTVQRERFGSIVGEVLSVSSFPVTTEAVASVVGNSELARELTAGASRIEVQAALARDPATPSGYQWTSGRGPDLQVSAGTSVAVRVVVERRRPLSYLIPALRNWGGL